MTYYRNKSTGNIEAKYVNCNTSSPKFNDNAKYTRIVQDKPVKIYEESFKTYRASIGPPPNPDQVLIDKVKALPDGTVKEALLRLLGGIR